MLYLIATIHTASSRASHLLQERHSRLKDRRDAGDTVQTAIIVALLGAAAVALTAGIVVVVNKYKGKIGGL